MSLFQEELERLRAETSEAGVSPEMVAEAGLSESLLPVPLSPIEKMMERDGKGKTFGKMLLGGMTGLTPFLMPELIGGRARYKAELEHYYDQVEQRREAAMLNGIDLSNPTAAEVAMMPPELQKIGAEAIGANLAADGGDQAVREMFKYSPLQWSQLSPESKRAFRNEYRARTGNTTHFDAQLEAEGKLPSQLTAAKLAEAEGTGLGNEITRDRQSVTGIRNQIKSIDVGIQTTQEIRDLIAIRQADPGKFAAGMRSVFGVETYEDGKMSATAAQGVIDQLKNVTLGAISKSELELLLGGLLDPTRSPESNLGSLDTALQRMEASKGLAIDDSRLAWNRLSENEGQAGFLEQTAEDDWYFNNLGEGSTFRAIPKADGTGEITFSQFSENVRRNHKAQNPYADPLTREELIIGFNEMREKQKGLWEAEQERKRREAEMLELARKGLTGAPLIFSAAGNE
jgi:hypothetical protein